MCISGTKWVAMNMPMMTTTTGAAGDFSPDGVAVLYAPYTQMPQVTIITRAADRFFSCSSATRWAPAVRALCKVGPRSEGPLQGGPPHDAAIELRDAAQRTDGGADALMLLFLLLFLQLREGRASTLMQPLRGIVIRL
eukprot:gene16363-42227_t